MISLLRNKDLKIKKAVNILRTNKILQQTTLSNDKSNGNANQDQEISIIFKYSKKQISKVMVLQAFNFL